jgi:hypothetical protein
MRKGKGRPDITEVMFYPGYPRGSNSSFDSLSNLNVFLPQAADTLPPPLRVRKTGRNHLNEGFTPLLPTGIGERF